MFSSSISGIAATGSDVLRGESVPGVDRQSERRAACRAASRSARQRRGIVRVMRVRPGVQLDRRGAERSRSVDRRAIGRDEETRANPGGVEPREPVARVAAVIARDVEPAFGRDLLAPLGDERHLMRPKAFGDARASRRCTPSRD